MTNIYNNESEALLKGDKLFAGALDLFFSVRPASPWWFLVVMYLAKEKKLKVVENTDPSDLTLAYLDLSLAENLDEDKRKKFEREGARSQALVADVEADSNICAIINTLGNYYKIKKVRNKNRFLVFNQKDSGANELLEQNRLFKVALALTAIPKEWYEKKGRDSFFDVLKKIQRTLDKSDTEFIQPTELSQLVTELLRAKAGTSVYNPYSGVCSYGVYLDNQGVYTGQEDSPIYAAVGELDLLFNHKRHSVCVKGDSFENWLGEFDYIISTPPFDLKITGIGALAEAAILRMSADSARFRAIGVYDEHICFPPESKLLRDGRAKYVLNSIVDEDWLESVILLPQRLFDKTPASAVIITIDKHKVQNKGFVKFIDGSDCYRIVGRQCLLDTQKLLDLCKSEASDKVRLSSLAEIKDMGYKLYPRLYTISSVTENAALPDGQRLMTLSKLLDPAEIEIPTEQRGRLLKVGDMFSNRIESLRNGSVIAVDDIPVSDLPNSILYTVAEDCIVIRPHRGGFKFCIVKTGGQKVYIPTQFVYVYTIKTSVISPDYLSAALNGEFFRQQISGYGSFSFYSNTAIHELLNLKIMLPNSLEEQHQMSEIDAQLQISERHREELWASQIEKQEAEFKQRLDNFVKNQRQRKHAVLQVFNEIQTSVKLIKRVLNDNDTVSRDTVVSPRFGHTFGNYIENLHEKVNKVIKMVYNFTVDETYGEPETIDLDEFLREYCKSKLSDMYMVEYKEAGNADERRLSVRVSRKDLTQMLDNLFNNAETHGFRDKEKIYTIRVEPRTVFDDDGRVDIAVSNNGVPASDSISLEKMFVWGIGHGSGIGCWQVKEIAEHFGGSVSYTEYPDDQDGFVCEFIISLPLTD